MLNRKRMGKGLLALFLSGLAGFSIAGPQIQHWTSETGAEVYFVESDSLPMVDVHVLYHAGGVYDGDLPGLASMTSLLIDKGAGDWDADEIANRLQSVGAKMGTSSAKDSAYVSFRTLTDPAILSKTVDTVATVLGKPTFAEADFDREKARVMLALQQREESPGAIADLAYMKALYGDHPYSVPAAGYIETVEKITRKEVEAFYQKYYVASNATIGIVGDLTRDDAEKLVQGLLRKVAKGQRAEKVASVQMPDAAKTETIDFPSTQTHVYTGMPVMAYNDPDYFSLYVGNHILGGGSFTSRIFQEIREKRGLSYSASSSFSQMEEQGPFTLALQTRNEKAQEALDVLHATLEEFIENGPAAEELEAAKKNITGGFVLRYDSNGKIANYVGVIGFYGLPLDYLDRFTDQVNAVTVESIQDAFRRRVHPDRFQTILVGGEAESP